MKKIVVLGCALLICAQLAGFKAPNVHRYITANFYQFAGNKQKAQQWYDELFSASPSPYSLKGYIHLLSDTGQAQKILQIAQQHDDKFDHDPEVQLIFANAFKRTGNVHEGDGRIIKLAQKFPTNAEIVFQATNSYVQRKELDNALSTINAYLNNAPRRQNNFVFYYLKAQIFTQLKKYPQALELLEETIKIHPRFPQAWLLRATLEEQMGRVQEAISGYSTYQQLTGSSNKQIEAHMMQLIMRSKGMNTRNQIFVINKTCLDTALHLFRKKEYQKALAHVDQCLIKNPKDIEGKLLKIQILTGMNDYQKAIALLTAWYAEDQQEMWLKTMHLLTRNNDTPAVIKMVTDAFAHLYTRYPHQKEPLLYVADLCIRYGTPEKARHLLLKAASQCTEATLKAKILHQAGMLAYNAGQFDQAKTILEQAAALGTDYPPLLNSLAYFYATKGKDLAKATKYIAQARIKDRYNPHFLDTFALVMYKHKKYESAAKLLEKLVEKAPLDFHMNMHLAKAHHKLQHKDQASQYITQAAGYAHTSQEHEHAEKLKKKWQV